MQVHFHIFGNARIKRVGKSQSYMVSKLPMFSEYQCGTVRLQLPDLTLTEFVPMDQLEKIADAASVAGTLAPSVHMLLGSEFNCLGV